MSEDTSKQDEQVEEQTDEQPDVEAHSMRARRIDRAEEPTDDEEGRRQRRPSGL